MKSVSTRHTLQAWVWVSLMSGVVALLVSPNFPYWEFELDAPQYPNGLSLQGYPHRIVGDVSEIDLLNHYIGMRELREAANVERRLALPGIGLMAACLVVAAFWRSR